MLYFASDYQEGAHPLILEKLSETNLVQTPGYGTDAFCDSARHKIRAACQCPDAAVHFISGGTQTNALVVDGLLRPWECVLCADTGHIHGHEAGAVEAWGHKIITLPHHTGKLRPSQIEEYASRFYKDQNNAHMTAPGLVYLSHPTEYGTLYTRDELAQIRDICQAYGMRLFLDGARLGYGLCAKDTEVTLPFLAQVCDAFYIGGTKVGALLGEAVVLPNPNAIPHFFTLIKKHGALLAKGRVLGIQFDTLFTDDLYTRIASHAIDMAEKLKAGLKAKGYTFFLETPTNQQFIVLENRKMESLAKEVSFSFWETLDDNHTVVRFATSWATQEKAVDALIELL
ncbi:MAG: low specificity L-threonine aldolase [Clostridia bacterium]|nr:low specificity L-threonine aldolase [Clostridia bacterium]